MKSKSTNQAKCYKCNEIMHFKMDYPQWKNKKGEKGETDFLSTMADKEVEDDLLAVSDDHRYQTSRWTLDSACSHHYMSNQSWFATYTKIDEGNVTLRDNHSYKISGIGSV